MTRTFSKGLCVAVLLPMGLTLLVCTGCGGQETDPAALDGTEWRLERWSANGLDPASFTITAVFADGAVGGTSAVNSYSGSYTTGRGDAFTVGPLAGTKMAGEPEATEAEAAYLRLLAEAASFEQTGDALTLFDAEGEASLVFAVGAGE
jgi:heat shock protein HslJ